MRRAVALLAATALVAGGCGGAKKAAPPPRDRGKEVIDALVAAAARHDAKALWGLLSGPSRQRLGSFERFRRTAAVTLASRVGSFARAPYREIVSERVTNRFGVVAIAAA